MARSGASDADADLEADLVVALAGAAVGHGCCAVPARLGDQVTDDHRARRARRPVDTCPRSWRWPGGRARRTARPSRGERHDHGLEAPRPGPGCGWGPSPRRPGRRPGRRRRPRRPPRRPRSRSASARPPTCRDPRCTPAPPDQACSPVLPIQRDQVRRRHARRRHAGGPPWRPAEILVDDHQHRVVTRHGAHDALEPASIQRRAHDVGRAGRRAQNDEVRRVRHLDHPFTEHPAKVVVRSDLLPREVPAGRRPVHHRGGGP